VKCLGATAGRWSWCSERRGPMWRVLCRERTNAASAKQNKKENIVKVEKVFSIQHDDEMWAAQMNKQDLVQCLHLGYSVREVFEVEDLTEYVAELEAQFAIVVERNEVLEDQKGR
jgi:hypothetical protein